MLYTLVHSRKKSFYVIHAIRSCLYCCSNLDVADFDPSLGGNYICYQLFLCTPHAHVFNLPEQSNVNSNVNKIDLSASILP